VTIRRHATCRTRSWEKLIQVLDEIVLVPAPLGPDREARRWYSHGAEACVVWSEGGTLLEPLPTFGPSCYALLATDVQRHEANEYALNHGYHHARVVPRRRR
jgi:hypothetical protein